MPCTLNSAVFHRALGAAHAGHVEHGEWSAPTGTDRTSENCIGHDASEAGTEGEHKYPIFAGGKLSAKGVGSSLGYAKKNDEHALIGPLQKIGDAIHVNQALIAAMFYLHTPTASGFEPALTMGTALPKSVAGEPCVYLWKDLIHKGEYTHPLKHFHLSVADHQLKQWLENFKTMKSNGVEVPINVDHSEAADDNRGYLIDVKREGDTLMGLCQFIGADAAKTAARNRVSVGVDPKYKDGEGREYPGGAIRHVALTPLPVVPDQQPFTIAASRSAAGGDVLTLAAVNSEPSNAPERSNTMAQKMLPCSEATINSLHKHVPGLPGAGDEEKLSRVGQHVETTHHHVKNLMQCMGMDGGDSMDAPAMLSRATDTIKARYAQDVEDAGGLTAVANLSVAQIADKAKDRRKDAFNSIQECSRLRERLEAKDGQIQTLSSATVQPLDPETLKHSTRTLDILLTAAVAKSGITPHVKEKLSKLLKGSGDKVNTLALSSAANPTGDGPLAFAIAEILAENERPALGEKTGLQTFSRVVPGEEQKSDKAPVEKFNEFVGAGKAPTL